LRQNLSWKEEEYSIQPYEELLSQKSWGL
jgi:hypothetical protein